ncbi:hypothetical protein Ahy_B05g075568 [Arachis hypogaea]|uniref:Uncharacterized protein n=1 Tax=Arachis hypogaea TaxID=3818 RepID=A0A444Z1H6_ARAHY|nr:hypothetical protein Ahy_B05g075568 [Arachis hypogaea]
MCQAYCIELLMKIPDIVLAETHHKYIMSSIILKQFFCRVFKNKTTIQRAVPAIAGAERGIYSMVYITTNLVECINSVLKDTCNLPVTTLIKAIFYRLNDAEAQECINVGHAFSEFAIAKLQANLQEVFEIREMPSGVKYTVDFRHIVIRLSCHQIFTCCAKQCLDLRVYVHDVYKIDKIHRVYTDFVPVGDPRTWPADTEPRLIPNPVVRQCSKGRFKSTRYLNEMDTRQMDKGHSRSRCPHRAESSSSGTCPIA